MKKGLLIPIGILILLVIIGFSGYNNLVTLDEGVNSAYAQVQTVVQRRADLIPNLVETVKGYASHEEKVLTQITEARAGITKAQTPEELAQADGQMTQALRNLNIVVENYPDLKANQNFIQLQDELAGSENRIATERNRYNESVKTYNSKVRRFPTSIYAGMLGFGHRAYFEATEGAQTPPTIDFNN